MKYEYRILKFFDSGVLEYHVEEMLTNGWSLVGQPVLVKIPTTTEYGGFQESYFCQAMIKTDTTNTTTQAVTWNISKDQSCPVCKGTGIMHDKTIEIVKDDAKEGEEFWWRIEKIVYK